ncbi:hypothetical protein AL755_02010 (plasmid) [Arthrobacter sp. ERGS1:01]|uniref:hypothetical protein n=1 Tax=Arthrobacter sp. ERGS1:01 TaxID=1704044 RepID=UPI0006B3FA36|nr:hypothetical protein [Arthrobacter sp. ERGS1:01]ALE04475.1 hypothetical protein AL755_02010 [Arthrobacter sp. ERGS1:01]
MLRVRPIHLTSRLEEYAHLLTALGLRCIADDGDRRVFDSGNGRVGLLRVDAGSAEDGTTGLEFEVRDHEIFVHRTLADGTPAELVDSDYGPAARVDAPDGTAFLAVPVAQEILVGPGLLTVVMHWHTTDDAGARKVLADIGARPLITRPGGGSFFRAKNGGLVATHPAGHNGVELGLEYCGDLAALGARLTAAGVATDMPDADALSLRTPDGTALRILRP